MKHKHKWVLTNTAYEYPWGYAGSALIPQEYAYLLCQCGRVKKVKIELANAK